ncbi:MAG TPA: hypothetical protein VER33_09095 [Polyangiaceae bacterium]|nr:hypothetical protein [Polyangiaceae bacterium]
MSMKSGTYHPPRSNDEKIPLIRGAVGRGVTLFSMQQTPGRPSKAI